MKLIAVLVIIAVMIEWGAAEDAREQSALTWREKGLILAADVERLGALILAGAVFWGRA